MKRIVSGLVVLLSVGVLMGMGSLGGQPEGTVPKASVNMAAKVTDRSGVTTRLAEFSAGGKVFLQGRRGDGMVTVDFSKMHSIDFGEVAGDDVPATVHLKTGESLELKVRKRQVFYGSTGYGAFQITAGNLKQIVFE